MLFSYTTVMSSFISSAFCGFMWRHIWRHRGPFGSSAFFVNNFWSNWDRKSRMAPLWWHWAPEATDMRLDPLAQSMTWEGGDLTLTSGSTLTLTCPKQKVYHSTQLAERITMVLAFWLCDLFWRSYEPTTKPRPLDHWPDLWGHQLTKDL